MSYRIGIGYDVHALIPGEFIIIGGVKIPNTHTTRAHSDGDVLLHAICDAMLGAAGLGDIGQHYPNNDHTYKNISSLLLLEKTLQLIIHSGYKIVNIDATIIAEKPKILAYSNEMKINISRVLKISEHQISIKATTNESIGFIGRGEGIAAIATILLETY
ncbi:MAG: 2-C-methyl-D-erythritol 2,4-cyclodiphosphate synthase [Bacteroidales bacterium]|nr:2-C-methyl-D-erythritol 2,4-cyclodiphosphate synthase [Bacteroidales bacterium]